MVISINFNYNLSILDSMPGSGESSEEKVDQPSRLGAFLFSKGVIMAELMFYFLSVAFLCGCDWLINNKGK